MYTPLMSINEAKFYLTARTRNKHIPMHHVDCDPSGSDILMLLALLFPIEGYREVTRERRARGDASKGMGGRGMGDVLFFLPPARSLARPRESRSVRHSKRKACSQTNMLLR